MKVVVQFDGACFGNPGPMGIGVVVVMGGKRAKEISEHIGTGTNNIAEYSAAIRGMKEAKKLRAAEVEMEGDSELIIRQMKGEYKVRNEKLQQLHAEIRELEKGFSSVKYKWIPREQNTIADELSKEGAAQSSKAHQ